MISYTGAVVWRFWAFFALWLAKITDNGLFNAVKSLKKSKIINFWLIFLDGWLFYVWLIILDQKSQNNQEKNHWLKYPALLLSPEYFWVWQRKMVCNCSCCLDMNLFVPVSFGQSHTGQRLIPRVSEIMWWLIQNHYLIFINNTMLIRHAFVSIISNFDHQIRIKLMNELNGSYKSIRVYSTSAVHYETTMRQFYWEVRLRIRIV